MRDQQMARAAQKQIAWRDVHNEITAPKWWHAYCADKCRLHYPRPNHDHGNLYVMTSRVAPELYDSDGSEVPDLYDMD